MTEQERMEILFQAIEYRPDTGECFWRFNVGVKSKSGEKAGSLMKRGYWEIQYNGARARSHRFAWFCVHGAIPSSMQVDHINHIRTDNRIANLRLVDQTGNSRNIDLRPENTSGVTGVTWDKNYGKWRSQIHIKGKCHYLGCFDVFEEAVLARKTAEQDNGFHPNHGIGLASSGSVS